MINTNKNKFNLFFIILEIKIMCYKYLVYSNVFFFKIKYF